MGIQEHFHFYPLAFAFLWLIFICLLFGLIRSKKMQYPHYSYFLSAHFFKLGSAIVYSLVYILFYEGGDTTAYWDGAINLHNLLLDSPFHFLDEMLTPSGIQNMGANFNISTGYPPGWIYRETESFMVSKITVFLSIITFKSYFASTLIVASLMSLSSWYFFCTLRKLQLHNEKILAITILFTPTVLFWCTGISKDSYVLISLLMLLSILVRVFVLKQPLSKHWIFILIFTYLIFSMRAYVIIAIIPSLLLAYTVKLSKDNLENPFTRRVKKLAMYFISILFLIVYFQIST